MTDGKQMYTWVASPLHPPLPYIGDEKRYGLDGMDTDWSLAKIAIAMGSCMYKFRWMDRYVDGYMDGQMDGYMDTKWSLAKIAISTYA